ncbi:putative metalloprotease CJM1_0395 family protein [Guyparkeria halophila]|uniref:Metalloprotease CJM1_0395 family protein n=1 Tax=Guyparkeria halophila TaxID=47960 RepID=A0ABZ0YVQ7_9GAMM|nr:putative metalloprotease CJM1_0395 family protein [Guyparkeria halophila]WQH15362.1 putative metalloprotease CJM1_0395 family protein [Guyparkeria halophila]
MTPIAASLPSLPPAPPFVPGGSTVVAPTGMGPATKPQAPVATAETPRVERRESDEARPVRAPMTTDATAIEEQRMLTDLKARDREVRAHENAHRAAGGNLVRGGSYDYQQGPDGKRYAVGGDVQIDTTPVPDDPRATADKMAQVIRAALAPAEPSPTDLAVAAQATAERNRAQAEAQAEAQSTGQASDQAESRAGPDFQGDDERSAAGVDSSDASTQYRRTANQVMAGSNLNAMA